MYRLLLVLFLATFSSVVALTFTEVDRQCIADNSDLFSNDNLVGRWYLIWKFTHVGAMVPFESCHERNITRPTAEVIEEYKSIYINPSVPYNIDDNPVLVTNGFNVDGMLMGHSVAKFFIERPRSPGTSNPDQLLVDAYRPLSSKYIMYTQCALRGFTRWLLTTDRYAPVAEIEELIKTTPELNEMDGQRHCATY